MEIKTYGPNEIWPASVIFPTQTHGNNIVEIITGTEDLSDCDGLFHLSQDRDRQGKSLILGIKTADCAPIVFWENGRYGIVHAGWRGLCNGIIEKMLENFTSPQVWVGPILPVFEIQKDFCYDLIYAKFGDRFFEEMSSTPPSPPCSNLRQGFDRQIGGEVGIGKYLFDFKSALIEVLPMAKFDPRSTYDEKDLASWRRDQSDDRNLTVVFP